MLLIRPMIVPILLLAGCAIVPAAPRATPPQALLLRSQPVMVPGDSEGGAVHKSAEQAVRAEFARRNVAIAGAAGFRVEVTLAQRAPKIGFSASGDAGQAVIEVKPQDGRIDLCREHVFRLTVAIHDSRSAAPAYRGSGERIRCGELDSSDLAAMAEVALGALR